MFGKCSCVCGVGTARHLALAIHIAHSLTLHVQAQVPQKLWRWNPTTQSYENYEPAAQPLTAWHQHVPGAVLCVVVVCCLWGCAVLCCGPMSGVLLCCAVLCCAVLCCAVDAVAGGGADGLNRTFGRPNLRRAGMYAKLQGGPLRDHIFFLLRTALKDRPKGPPTPTANSHQTPTATNSQPPTASHQPPPTASGDQPPTANHCQPPPTTNHQPPTAANHHQPPVANCQPPTAANRQLPTATNHG